MTEARQSQPHKRRRSAIACVNCHDRKVRCNAAFQGFPCSNCLQDRVRCEVYGRKGSSKVPPRRPIRPRPTEDSTSPTNLLTPSTQGFETLSDEAASSLRSPEEASPAQQRPTILQRHPTPPDQRQGHDSISAQTESGNPAIVPFFAGESEGLEFIFDICAPNRALKGSHYIVTRQVHKREHLRQKEKSEPTPFPDEELRQELLIRYFHYVHPFLPLIDTYSFFHKYDRGVEHVSRLLLWSMFFAAASFVPPEFLKRIRFPSRKSLKEFCYQRAKDTYEQHDEPEKEAVIQSAVLLALWYVDLEDRDGTWIWQGIAISLAHTIGLQRDFNISDVPRAPFPPSQQILWKRIWWCVYYREAFSSLGFGRPMRLNLDDSDLTVPTVNEILSDTQVGPLILAEIPADKFQQLPESIKATFLPPDRECLANMWIHLLHLAMQLQHVLATHYRPRRPLLSFSQLEIEDADLWKLKDSAPIANAMLTTTSILHAHHLQAYFNAVFIALYRPYVLSAPDHLSRSQQDQLRALATSRVKEAAASTTAAINKLVSLDLIELSSNMLVTTIMFAAQIHLFEIKKSEGLARQYASHHFNLHTLVLSQLRRTYWTADHQYKLFTETLKAVENGELNSPVATNTSNNPTLAPTPSHHPDAEASEAATAADKFGEHAEGPGEGDAFGAAANGGRSLDEFFMAFNPNPFFSLSTDFDPGTPGDWVLGTTTPLNLDPP